MAISPTPGHRGRLNVGHAIGLYFIYMAAFVVGGGLGAGIPAMLYEVIAEQDIARGDHFILYAVMFGVTGYIAYRLAQRVAEGDGRL